MINSTKLTLIGAIFLLGGYRCTHCVEVKHHGESYGYNLTLPSGWIQIPQDDFDKAFANVINSNNNIQFNAGFQLSSSTSLLEYPYVIVIVLPYVSFGFNRQIYESEFPKIIKAITGLDIGEIVEETFASEARHVSNLQINKPHLDIALKRFLWELEMNIEGVGQIKGICAGHFGRNSLVQVIFYSIKQNWDDLSDARTSIIESFYFDDNQAYNTELASNSKTSTIWGRITGKVVYGVVVGGLVGLISGIFAVVKRKRIVTESNMNTHEH